MRVLVVSDTHRKNDLYIALVERLSPDMVIHCGDAEGAEFEFREVADCPVEVVLGNNDFFSALPGELTLDIGPYKVWVVHGHNFFVSMGRENLKEEAAVRGADIVLFGHTHRPVIDTEGEVIAVNPGSLSYPRQEGRKPSYAVMVLDENDKISFSIKFLG